MNKLRVYHLFIISLVLWAGIAAAVWAVLK